MSAPMAEADALGAATSARLRAPESLDPSNSCRSGLHLIDIRAAIRYVDIGAGANPETGRNTRALLAESYS
jgi:hypothetical protein